MEVHLEITVKDVIQQIYEFEGTEVGSTFLAKYGDLMYRHSLVEEYAYTFLVSVALDRYTDALCKNLPGEHVDEEELTSLKVYLKNFLVLDFFKKNIDELACQDLLYDDKVLNLPGMVAFQTRLYSNLENEEFAKKLTNRFSFRDCVRVIREALSSNLLRD